MNWKFADGFADASWTRLMCLEQNKPLVEHLPPSPKPEDSDNVSSVAIITHHSSIAYEKTIIVFCCFYIILFPRTEQLRAFRFLLEARARRPSRGHPGQRPRTDTHGHARTRRGPEWDSSVRSWTTIAFPLRAPSDNLSDADGNRTRLRQYRLEG